MPNIRLEGWQGQLRGPDDDLVLQQEPMEMEYVPDEPLRKRKIWDEDGGPIQIHRPGPFLPFKQQCISFEDVRMRVDKSIIDCNGPMYIAQVSNQDGSAENTILYCQTPQDIFKKLFKNLTDFRSPEPGYINYRGQVVYLARRPERQQRQGLHRENARLSTLEGERLDFYGEALVQSLCTRKDVAFQPAFWNLLEERAILALRLSNKIAVDYRGFVFYCHRRLGELRQGRMRFLREADKTKPWIKKELATANIQEA